MINKETISEWRDNVIENLNFATFDFLLKDIEKENPTFTPKFVKTAIKNIVYALTPEKYYNWITKYNIPNKTHSLGIICAGNVPAVSFFDVFMGLVTNHEVYVKLSHSDTKLIPYLFEQLFNFIPEMRDRIKFVESIHSVKAEKIIATGSNNANRYFLQYFADKKAVLRHDRKSIAVINHDITENELNALANDIFLYFGLGCRNVSLILLPHEFSLNKINAAFKHYSWISDNLYYKEIINYYRAYFSLMFEDFIDNDFYLLRERLDLYSPISVINYAYYNDISQVENFIKANKENLQCIVGNYSLCNTTFGKTQKPELSDYPDDVDIMRFLTES